MIEQTIRAMLDQFKLPDISVPDFSGLDWVQSTERLRQSFYRASRSVESDAPNLAEISNLLIEGEGRTLRARLYVPLAAGLGAGPAIVFFHGGGFVMGDLESHDMMCRRLAHASRCRIIAIDYRLAPEHKFPAAHDDALLAWHWVLNQADMLNFDTERLAVAGDSAGGNLAAALSHEMNRADGVMPAFQLLIYPLLQFADIRSTPLNFQQGGFFISSNLFNYFRDAYLGEAATGMDARISPLFAPEDEFRGLPPTHMVLCGWDPLQHEGRAYADKLAGLGVPVTLRNHPGMVHGFMNLTAVSQSVRDAIEDCGHVVGRALGALSPPSRS